jgi:hypothetical protein
MNDADAEQIIQRYGTSWYAEIDHIDPSKIAGHGAKEAALRDISEPGALTAAMAENVAEAATNVDGVRDRYRQARLDGLFDPDLLQSLSKRIKPLWIAAVETQQGDRARCVAELAHWKGYLAWAWARERRPAAPPAVDTRMAREPGDDSDEAEAVA